MKLSETIENDSDIRCCWNCQFKDGRKCFIADITNRKNIISNSNPCNYFKKLCWRKGEKKSTIYSEGLFSVDLKSENENDIWLFVTKFLSAKIDSQFAYNEASKLFDKNQEFIEFNKFVKEELGKEVFNELVKNFKKQKEINNDK